MVRMRHIVEAVLMLAVCAAAGAMSATTFTCAVGLANGTDTWCGVGYFWLAAIPLAIVIAWVAGAELLWPFTRLKLNAWWHYALAGGIAALPVWGLLAQPFTSVRWQQSGFYDSLNYLGTGVASAVLFWFLFVRSKRGAA